MRAAVLAFFFLSGAAGLLYELVWIRAAGTVIGNTTYAVGTVVAVYMGGLALGAWVGGRAADRRRRKALLRLYGLLEAAVAATALLVPALLRAAEPLFRLLWDATGEVAPLYAALRISLVAAVIFPPTLLMGATLPVLTRFLSSAAGDAPREAGRAYAVNSFGGAIGTLAAGFWLIPAFGLRATTLVAAAANLAVAAASLALARDAAPAPRVALAAEPPPRRAALVVAALSGAAALAYEIAWTRSLVLSFGSTVYAFTIILAAFILGLAVGSAAAARVAARLADPLRALGAVQAAAGVLALALLPFLGDLPVRVAPLVETLRDSYGKLLLAEFALAGLFVLLPAAALGAVFPLACRLAAGSDAQVGRSVAAVYAWNTAGAIAGTVAGSFLLVPAVGLSGTIAAAATVNLAVAAWAWRSALSAVPAAAAAAGWALVLAAPWDAAVLASGSFIYSDAHARGTQGFSTDLRSYLRADTEILARHWDSYGLVTVHRARDGVLLLRVNGKTDASTGPSDRATMVFVGHLPALHHPAPRRALLVGLGGGLTLRALAAHPFERIDCVEISPAVVRAAAHFREANGDVLSDPRVRLLVADARNALLFGRDSYDVIVSQPSNLWVSGMANLFTREFFEEASRRLAPGGLFGQWIHAYKLDTESFRQVVRTFFAVFPHGSLWEIFPGHDYFLLGSVLPPPAPWEALAERLVSSGALDDLLAEDDPAALLKHLVADAAGAREAAGPGPLLTDDRCAIEYAAPKALYRDPRPQTLAWLDGPRRRPAEAALYAGLDAPLEARLAAQRDGRRRLAGAVRAAAEGRHLEAIETLEDLRERFGRDPRTAIFFDLVCEQVIEAAVRRIAAGQAAPAARLLAAVPPSSERYAEARFERGELFLLAGDRDQARQAFDEAARARDGFFAAAAAARREQIEGRPRDAVRAWREALARRPEYPPGWFELALALARIGEREEAVQACRETLRRDPHHEAASRLLADLLRVP